MTILARVSRVSGVFETPALASTRASVSPRVLKRNARQRLILDVAREEFLEHGFAATSMSDIAARIGGSKTTLWSYFPCKKMLFLATVEDAASSLHTQLDEILRSGFDTEQTLHAFGAGLVDRMVSSDSLQLHRLIVGEGGRFPELGQIFYEAAYRPSHCKLEAYLVGEVQSGRLRKCDASQAAHELFGLMLHPQQFLLWSVQGTLVEAGRTESYVRTAINSFLRSYLLKPHQDADG